MIPDEPGTYALLLQSAHKCSIAVARLGTLDVRTGFYVYVGSALGPGGLRARTRRHASTDKKRRWHIDHLLDVAALIEIWYAAGKEKREHAWAQAFSRIPGVAVPMRGFGSSDCRCNSHLFYFARRPSARAFERPLRTAIHRVAVWGSGRRA